MTSMGLKSVRVPRGDMDFPGQCDQFRRDHFRCEPDQCRRPNRNPNANRNPKPNPQQSSRGLRSAVTTAAILMACAAAGDGVVGPLDKASIAGITGCVGLDKRRSTPSLGHTKLVPKVVEKDVYIVILDDMICMNMALSNVAAFCAVKRDTLVAFFAASERKKQLELLKDLKSWKSETDLSEQKDSELFKKYTAEPDQVKTMIEAYAAAVKDKGQNVTVDSTLSSTSKQIGVLTSVRNDENIWYVGEVGFSYDGSSHAEHAKHVKHADGFGIELRHDNTTLSVVAGIWKEGAKQCTFGFVNGNWTSESNRCKSE